MRMIFGTDTTSDAGQCVILDLTDEAFETLEATNSWDTIGAGEPVDGMTVKTIVAWEDIVESLALILDGEDLPIATVNRIVAALYDAVDNND